MVANPLCTFLAVPPRYAQLRAGRMCYYQKGEGQPLFMLHGNPTWSYFYRALIADLSQKYRTIACDNLGCGFSARQLSENYEYNLQNRIADFTEFIEKLDIKEKLTLIVHDWGVAIGIGYALQNLQKIRRLIIFNGAAFRLPVLKNFPWQLRLFKTRLLGNMLIKHTNFFLQMVLATCTQKKLTPEIRDAYRFPYKTAAQRLALAEFVADIPLAPHDRSYGLLTKIEHSLQKLATIPTLICWGNKDFVFDEDFCRRWQSFLPHARVKTYDDCGHLLLEDDPQRISADVTQFMESTA